MELIHISHNFEVWTSVITPSLTIMSANKETFVKLDVGGTCYETTLSTINNSPNSMLAKAVSDRWKKEDNNDPISFDRNGQRFKYVLDYLRDGKVNLPVGETKATFKTELGYFGIDIHRNSITSEEDVTLISFHRRFEGHLSHIENTMKAHRKNYAVYKIGLDVYKEAVVQNAKQCTSGNDKFEFEIEYYCGCVDEKTVCEVLEDINFQPEFEKGVFAKDDAFIDAINTVVKDVNVIVTGIEKYDGCVCYGVKVETSYRKIRGQKRSRK